MKRNIPITILSKKVFACPVSKCEFRVLTTKIKIWDRLDGLWRNQTIYCMTNMETGKIVESSIEKRHMIEYIENYLLQEVSE